MLKRSLFALGTIAAVAVAPAVRAQDTTSSTTTTTTTSSTSTDMAQDDMAVGARPVHFGIAAGATIPVGDVGDIEKTGFHVGGLVGFSTPMLPFGLRVEGTWHRLTGKTINILGTTATAGDLDIVDGTLNGIFQVPTQGGINPYLIAGPGVYYEKAKGGDSKTSFGLNGGAGLKFNLSGFSTFVEARYHYIFSKDDDKGFGNAQMIPISFGIMF